MFRRLGIFVALFACTAALAQQEPAKPNFTGIWNVDLEKSDFGGLDKPLSARYLIRQTGAKIELQYEQDGHVTRVDVIPDGEEHVLETNPDNENVARVYWTGGALVFEGRIRPLFGSNVPPIKWNSRWTLSPDKQVLSIERHVTSANATATQKVLFNKQPIQAKGQ